MKNFDFVSTIIIGIGFGILIDTFILDDLAIKYAEEKTTYVSQNISNNILKTYALYKSEPIYLKFDTLTLETNDSMKLIRYNEAKTILTKLKTVDSFNNIK